MFHTTLRIPKLFHSSQNGRRANAPRAAAERMGSSSIDCKDIVPIPRDAFPARTPQVLHTAVARRVYGLDVVVIGDSSTDAISCFAAHARSATVVPIEANERECVHLRARAAKSRALGLVFAVNCNASTSLLPGAANLRTIDIPDADMYFFSQAAWRTAYWRQWMHRGVAVAACREYFGNCDDEALTSVRYSSTWRSHRLDHVDSFDLLRALRSAQATGAIRATAEVVMGFDEDTMHDGWTYRKLQDLGWMSWNQSFCLPPSELALCVNHTMLAGSRASTHVCRYNPRARLRLSGGRIDAIPAAALDATSCHGLVGSDLWMRAPEAARSREVRMLLRGTGPAAVPPGDENLIGRLTAPHPRTCRGAQHAPGRLWSSI